jgi:hypothetical protein
LPYHGKDHKKVFKKYQKKIMVTSARLLLVTNLEQFKYHIPSVPGTGTGTLCTLILKIRILINSVLYVFNLLKQYYKNLYGVALFLCGYGLGRNNYVAMTMADIRAGSKKKVLGNNN